MKTLLLLLLTLCTAAAQYQKLDAPIDSSARTLSFHLFHFDNAQTTQSIQRAPLSIDAAAARKATLACTSIGTDQQTHSLLVTPTALRVQTYSQTTGIPIGPSLYNTSKKLPTLDTQHYARRTFLLHDGNNRWAIGYAPALTLQQLSHAIHHIITTQNLGYSAAYQLSSGNSAGLWIHKQEYQPFYLKELSPPKATLCLQKR